MSEDRNFVARWSRLKRQPGSEKDGPGPLDSSAQTAASKESELGQPEAPFDVSKLPPIESISAGTDIRDFLQAGVPAELTKAALRRAWSEDPAIRDFIGIAENQWDFTDPTTIPGFGPLRAGDNVQDLVAQAMGKLEEHVAQPEAPKTAAVEEPAASTRSSAHQEVATASHTHGGDPVESREDDRVASEPLDGAPEDNAAAPQHDLKRRKHGRALPRSN